MAVWSCLEVRQSAYRRELRCVKLQMDSLAYDRPLFIALYFSEPLLSLVEVGIAQLTFPSYKEVSRLYLLVLERLASWNNCCLTTLICLGWLHLVDGCPP
jgi:hypothetical protein